MSGKVKVIDDALTELNQSFGQTNRNVGDTFEEIDISLLDGSRRYESIVTTQVDR